MNSVLPGNSNAQLAPRKYFLHAITNATSDLPLSVIKELKSGFKNYIPLALCSHKACFHATCTTEAVDTEIEWNDKGEIRLKQKAMMVAKDHYMTTDDFTEMRKNFVHGLHRYLIMSDNLVAGGLQARECADMFAEFFSVIAAWPDYTQDWPSYRGYIIELYTSWIGQRNDLYGLIFDEQLFHKYKMRNLVPTILEQLRRSAGGSGGVDLSAQGRGHVFQGGSFGSNHGGYQAQPFHSSQPSGTFCCYLCSEPHLHKDHQGATK